jgi:hypothetical protein
VREEEQTHSSDPDFTVRRRAVLQEPGPGRRCRCQPKRERAAQREWARKRFVNLSYRRKRDACRGMAAAGGEGEDNPCQREVE